MKTTDLTRLVPALACFGVLSSACILVADDDASDTGANSGSPFDTEGEDDDTGDTDGDTDEPAGDTGGDTEGDTGDTDGESDTDGDEPLAECGDNVLADPGFEAGSPNGEWSEASEVFGSPLCDESCTEDEGAQPYAGEWFAWFGGLEQPETASLAQTFSVTGDAAKLSFFLAAYAEAEDGEDAFFVTIDDSVVFMVTDAEAADYDGYTEVRVDISEFADGQPHELAFIGEFTAEATNSFFLDEVAVAACDDVEGGGDTDTDGSDTGSDTDGSDTDGSDTGGSDSGETGDTGTDA